MVWMGVPFLKISLLLMGVSGIVAQIVLLRELLVSFFGNELTLGIILGNWLVLEAIGSFYLGKSVEKTGKKIEIYVLLQLFFSLAFPAMIYLSRIFKNFLPATPGEGLGLVPIFFFSFLILLPVSIPHGALFTYGCKLYSRHLREDASTIGKVYILETIGSIIGGLLLTLLLIQHLHSFEIALAISLMNALIAAFLLWPGYPPPSTSLCKGLFILGIACAIFFAVSLFTPIAQKIDSSSVRSQKKNLEVIHHENSIYGNITVTKREEQFTFFTDGTPSITAPVPDIASLEDLVHFSMLSHEKPESVLILSGGAGGMIHEILKYPVKQVDYVELDPLLLKLVQKFSTPLTQSELSDNRVHIHYKDGRFFIHKTREKYDVIFIGLPAPQELQTNRLFSLEFFSLAKAKMKPGGIIVLTLPGSLTYISPELRDLNGCILDTVKSVFGYVKIIPGDVNLYLASDSAKLERVTAKEIMERHEERKIQTNLFTKAYTEYRLDEGRLKWFFKSMGDRKVRLNSDFHPLGVFYNLSYWNALFSPHLSGIFKWFEGFNFPLGSGLVAIFTISLTAIMIKIPRLSRSCVPYAIFTSGLTGMIFDLAIIFTFQTLYGYLYYQIGLLITIFMVGIALSSLYITRRLDRIKKDASLFLKTEMGIIIFALLLPFVFSIPAQHLDKTGVYVLLYAIFLAMSFLSGVFIGLQFPLANKIYLRLPGQRENFARTSGLLYGADLLGGFVGGIFGGFFLLPVLGLKESCFLMAMIKGSSFFLFLFFIKRQK